ncbi:MAG TPA: cation transporter [Acidimicrobiales bacterium]
MPTTTATVCRRFEVEGMSCDHCKVAITAALSAIDGVTDVVVDVAAGTVIVESVAPLEHAQVAAAIDDAGYRLV